jgi:hypothetical protein
LLPPKLCEERCGVDVNKKIWNSISKPFIIVVRGKKLPFVNKIKEHMMQKVKHIKLFAVPILLAACLIGGFGLSRPAFAASVVPTTSCGSNTNNVKIIGHSASACITGPAGYVTLEGVFTAFGLPFGNYLNDGNRHWSGTVYYFDLNNNGQACTFTASRADSNNNISLPLNNYINAVDLGHTFGNPQCG